MNAEEKLARQRLSDLERAQALGKVSEACRRRGISRTQFYEYKRRFQRHGLSGLKDLPPIHHVHPMTTPPEVVQRILGLSMAHPSRGCNFLEAQLQLEGISVSAVTIQNILNSNGLGTRYDRWLRLEEQHATEPVELSSEQVRFLEKQNPQCTTHRRWVGSATWSPGPPGRAALPGHLLRGASQGRRQGLPARGRR